MDLPKGTDRSALRRFGFAVLASFVALLLRYLINGLMGDALPLMSGLFAVIVAGWYGGLWPGLLATALCAIFGVALFVDGGWVLLELGDRLRLGGFLIIGTVTSLLFEALHSAQVKIDSERAHARTSREQRERSQMHARDTELRHRLALEASFDAMYEWAVETNRMNWNEGVHTLFGYTDKEVDESFAWWSEHIHPADRERTLESFELARQARSAKWSAEYRLRCADGRYVWVLDRAGLMFDIDGQLTRVVGAVQDISERQRTAETLAHFKALLEAQPSSILVLDPELRIAAASDAYLRATMRERAEIVGRLVFEAFPDDADAAGIGPVRASFERVLASGRAEQMPLQSYAVQKPASEGGGFKKIWWSLYHFPVLGPRGEVAFVVQRADDVTPYVRDQDATTEELTVGSYSPVYGQELRNLEHAQLLAQANRRLGLINQRLAFFAELSEATRSLLDPEAIVATVAGMLGRHLAVSRCAWLEFADDGEHFEVLGDYTDGVASIRGHHRTSDYGLPALMRGQSTYVMADVEANPEALLHLSAYRRIQVRATISVPLRREGRAVAGLAVHESMPREWTQDEIELVEQVAERSRDALERTRALRALASSEARLRGILDAMPARVGTVDADGRVDYLHPSWAAYTGLGFDEVSGAKWSRMFHPDDLTGYRRAREACLKSGAAFAYEVRVRRHDGEYRWHLAQMSPVRDAAGRILSWVSAVTEVHELKLAQQRLREADRAKDEFLATLAHELRNPIAPIANAVELLRMKGAEDKLRSSTLELMSRQLTQMVRLVDDLLDVSRITTGKLILQRAAVSLAEVVRNAVESVDPLIHAGGHRLEIVLPQDPVTLHGDAARLAQVLANLLTNSAKYSERPGVIRLSATREAGELRLVVRDEGIGIAPEALPRVFDMFAQSDRSLSRSQGGLGIGLSLVRRLVEMHGGRVEGASEGVGRGSTFTVHLPLQEPTQAQSAPAAGAAQPGDDARSTVKRRVLVADDNLDSADSLAALLDLWGHEVMIARDGVEALERAAAFKPDVMVLDLGMPRRDGLDTAREVRGQSWGREVTLIALSGWGQPADRERTRAAGFDHHLVKPVDGAKLEKLLEVGAKQG